MNPDNSVPVQEGEKVVGTTEHNKLMGVLAYLGILVVIPLLVAKDDPFVKFHVKQGLVLLIIEVGWWLLVMSLYFLLMLMPLFQFAIFVFIIIGIVNVARGKQKELPFIGNFSKHFTF